MNEEFGPDFITVTDEDGNDIELELLDVLEHKGQTYMAFFPAVLEGTEEESDDYGMVILKSIQENGEELLHPGQRGGAHRGLQPLHGDPL